MMVSDEEKRWIVVGIAMNKVAAPVLQDAVKQGMDTNYANLDRHCQLTSPPALYSEDINSWGGPSRSFLEEPEISKYKQQSSCSWCMQLQLQHQ